MNAPRIAAIVVGVLSGVVGLGFWAAFDGSQCTLPIGSSEVRVGQVGG